MWIYFKLKVAFKKKNICAVVLFLQEKQWWALISTEWAASSFSFRETSWSGQMRLCTLARCGSVCAWLPWQHSKSLFEIAWKKEKKKKKGGTHQHPQHTHTPKLIHCCAHTHTPKISPGQKSSAHYFDTETGQRLIFTSYAQEPNGKFPQTALRVWEVKMTPPQCWDWDGNIELNG